MERGGRYRKDGSNKAGNKNSNFCSEATVEDAEKTVMIMTILSAAIIAVFATTPRPVDVIPTSEFFFDSQVK